MKIYKTRSGILLEHKDRFFLDNEKDWDKFINQNNLYDTVIQTLNAWKPAENPQRLLAEELLPPIGTQEVWAAGVTYYRSRNARMEESKNAGGGSFYDRVYEADRPELFFKATHYRTVGHNGTVRVRRDSSWDVPEPEFTLMVTRAGKIIGYTIGNDMSSRSIEGENPLYLPQAKSYEGSTAIGPCIYVSPQPPPADTPIRLVIERSGEVVFQGETALSQMKRTPDELVGYLYRECAFPQGCLLMTGTGIIPENDFTLASGDVIRITIDPIGTLINTVA